MAKNFQIENYKMKEKKLRKSGNGFLIKFLIIFFVGYGLFFTSSIWLGKDYEGVSVTPIGTTVNMNNRNVTVDAWQYSKKQQLMEVIIELENLSIDGIDKYLWDVRGKGVIYKTKIIEEGDGYYVLRVYDVKEDWAEVSLNIDLKESDKKKNKDFELIKMYTNDKHVKNVSYIPRKDLKGYKKTALNSKIEFVNGKIAKNRSSKDAFLKKIEEADRKIEELSNKLDAQTEKEKEETVSSIDNIKSEKEELKEKVKACDTSFAELNEKVRLLHEKIAEIDGAAPQSFSQSPHQITNKNTVKSSGKDVELQKRDPGKKKVRKKKGDGNLSKPLKK